MTPRRWIHCCNPELSQIITEQIGDLEDWITDLDSLRELSAFSEEEEFVQKFMTMKRNCKIKLKTWVKANTGIDIPVDALYDVQVKRMHEYKRQLMNILYMIYRY